MIDYANNEIKYDGCPGCAYAKGQFSLPCGMIYQDENFTVSQDWELPIPGFVVICPIKKHVEHLAELDYTTTSKLFLLARKIEDILIKNNIAQGFNIVAEEKAKVHLHIWIMPQYDWMQKIHKSSIANLNDLFSYAKREFKNHETFEKINEIATLLRKELKKTEC